MGDELRGIYPKTLVTNGLLSIDKYKDYVHQQVIKVNAHKPVLPLFRFALSEQILDLEIHEKIKKQMCDRFKKMRLMGYWQK